MEAVAVRARVAREEVAATVRVMAAAAEEAMEEVASEAVAAMAEAATPLVAEVETWLGDSGGEEVGVRGSLRPQSKSACVTTAWETIEQWQLRRAPAARCASLSVQLVDSILGIAWRR